MRADGDRAVRVAILDMGISVPIELNVVPLRERRSLRGRTIAKRAGKTNEQ